MILIDTSVWIDFLRGEDSYERKLLHDLIDGKEELSITEIIITEILQGVDRDKDFHTLREYLLEFPLYTPKGVETYIRAAQIYRDCRGKGKTIRKTIDCIIAAICIENDLILFHKDTDFASIEACAGLKVLKYK